MVALKAWLALAAVVVTLLFGFPAAHAQTPSPAPAPSSDGTTIDQGVAYVLMLVALMLTYLIHPLDASIMPSPYRQF